MKILKNSSRCAFNPRNTVDVKPYHNDVFSKKLGSNDDDDDENTIVKRNLSRSGNHIYFYDVIDTQTQMWLQTQMTAAYEEYIISNAKELAHSHSIINFFRPSSKFYFITLLSTTYNHTPFYFV